MAAHDNDGSIALITGAASGIGAAVASSLAARGWRVAGLDLRESETELPLVADVADGGAVREAADRAARELALGGGAEDAHYVAAKGAIIGLTKSLAAEVAGRGVRVNSVAPGPTDTPLLPPDSRDPAYLRTLPLRRLVSPEEVAETVLFLAEEGGYYSGQVLSPNAGAVI